MPDKKKIYFSTLQIGWKSIKNHLALSLAKEPVLLIDPSTELIQLCEDGNVWLNIVIVAEEIESYQNTPTIKVELGNEKLVKGQNFSVEWINGNLKPIFNYSSQTMRVSFRETSSIGMNIGLRGKDLKCALRNLVQVI